MPDILAMYAGTQPDKAAVIDDRPDGSVQRRSYAEFNEDVNRLAHVMLGLGIAPHDRVVWCGKNSIGVVTMMHAARKIGATAVPLNYRLSPEEAAYVVENCDARLVYADAEFAELFEQIRPQCPLLEELLIFEGPARAGQQDAAPLLAAASGAEPPEPGVEARSMIYTSGTTGNPKGAVRSGAGDPEQIAAMLGLVGYRPDDIYLTTGPLYHSGPGGFMNIAHALGQSVVVQRRFEAEDWLRLVEKYGITSTFAAPTPIRMVCNLPEEVRKRYDVSSMRVMVANAAPWPFALKEQYVACFPPESLWEVYGSTELGVDAILEPKDQMRKPGSCGRPAPLVDLVLIDDQGKEIDSPNVPGELYVRSKSVLNTYHKAHDKYEADKRGDYHTVGDVAYFDEEGFFYICDRKKDMIISGGMNIYPAEIEAALEQHQQVFEAAVFGIPSEEWGESVHAVVVRTPGASLDEAAVTAYAREHLASYKIPRSVSFMEELPKTGSGKILKRSLREPYWKEHERRVG